MNEARLMMDNKLNIRLLSVTFPDPRKASVAFELFSYGYTMGGPTQTLLTLTQETSPYTLNGSQLPDYNRIVESAAKKLESDFKVVLATLATTYSEG